MLQRVVAPAFQALDARAAAGRVLEVGCGGGSGTPNLFERFGAREVFGFDLDLRMLQVARRRRAGLRVFHFAADVTALPLRDGSCDSVFDFGAVHIVPRWDRALDEIRRVLRGGGRYFFEVVTNPILRIPYPLAMDGFESMRAPRGGDFVAGLSKRGLMTESTNLRFWPWTQLVGDLIGVATLSPTAARSASRGPAADPA